MVLLEVEFCWTFCEGVDAIVKFFEIPELFALARSLLTGVKEIASVVVCNELLTVVTFPVKNDVEFAPWLPLEFKTGDVEVALCKPAELELAAKTPPPPAIAGAPIVVVALVSATISVCTVTPSNVAVGEVIDVPAGGLLFVTISVPVTAF